MSLKICFSFCDIAERLNHLLRYIILYAIKNKSTTLCGNLLPNPTLNLELENALYQRSGKFLIQILIKDIGIHGIFNYKWSVHLEDFLLCLLITVLCFPQQFFKTHFSNSPPVPFSTSE